MSGRDNLTLTESELMACRPVRGEGGRVLRAFCPFHGSDNQRSLRVDVDTGRFFCFACGAWGYTAESRERWQQERTARRSGQPQAGGRKPMLSPAFSCLQNRPEPARADLSELLAAYQKALPGSWGEEYLKRRGIPLGLAKAYGVGYAAAGHWAHKGRDWKWGRLVFPHTDPAGRLVNLYGRAVGANEKVPKALRHDHLPGQKGYFNAAALRVGEGPLFVCEGAFDALALMAAGYSRTVATFGVDGWRWEWARNVRQLVLALDADEAGQRAWRELARHAVLRGKRVAFLPPEAYGGHKDASEAWAAGALRVGEWPEEPDQAALPLAEAQEPASGQGWELVDSEVLGELVVFAVDEAAAQRAPAGFVVYTAAELERLDGLTPDGLRCVHKAKKMLAGRVTQVLEVAV